MSWLCPLCGSTTYPNLININSVGPSASVQAPLSYPAYTNTGGYSTAIPLLPAVQLPFNSVVFYQCHGCSVLFTDPARFTTQTVNETNVVKAQALMELAR